MLREDDEQFVCSRCGLVNPGDGEPCTPLSIEPVDLPDAEAA